LEKFTVNVTEISYGFVEFEADSEDEAKDKAEDEYHYGNVVWSSVEFKAHEVEKQN
jgi:hypothetical protein